MRPIILITCILSTLCHAELRVASLFQDKMVLQRDVAIPVWGWADAGEKVAVSFGDQSEEVVTNEDGRWRVDLKATEASFDPREMTISTSKDTINLKDVLVGEVWICSGQSNMAMKLGAIPEVKALLPSAKHIRSFEVEQSVAFEEQGSCKGEWVIKPPNSAVAFAFAYHLQEYADAPVGIILTAWGSSSIEAWMPRDMVETVPHFKTVMERFDADTETKERIQTILDGPRPFVKGDNVFLRRQSNILYNAMMHPLAPYACRGIAWYQGERNTQSMEGMVQEPWYSLNSGMRKYGDTLKAWIKRYRKEWGNEEFQAMVVMLPGYHNEDKALNTGPQLGPESPITHSWAWMRESQIKALELPNTAVINTIDLGHLTNIHPKDKLPIGQRLAHAAARNTLGLDIIAEGPVFKNLVKTDKGLVVNFENAAGLKTTDGAAPKGFWVADDSQKWVRAEAEISAETIVLTAEEVQRPLYVRYAFAGKPEVNLVNGAELPARPFRTDSFGPVQ